MDGTLTQVTNVFYTYVPNLLAALAILVVGWLIALGVSALIRAALRRTTIDDRLAGALSGDSSTRIDTASWVSTAVFWLIMLFVLIGFFQALSLPAISTPLNAMLSQLLGFLPNLFGALILAGIAWLLATVLRLVVSRGLKAVRFDERVGGQVSDTAADPARADIQRMLQRDPETGAPISAGPTTTARPVDRAVQRGALSDTLANAVYWLVFLLFLPAILDTLGLEGLLQPVQSLLDKVLAYLPNIFAAGVVLLVGWFIARVVQRIVTNLAAAVGVDRLGDRIGLSQVLGSTRLSGVLGTLVYVLILVPVLITALNALQIEAVTAPASAMLATFLAALPLIFAAAIVLVIAFFVARIIGGVVTNVLRGLGFDQLVARTGISTPATPPAGQTPEAQRAIAAAQAAQAGASTPEAAQAVGAVARTTPSDVVGTIVMVGIMLFASIAALNLLGFTVLTALVSEFTVLIGQILLGLVIFGIGLYLANLAARAIMSTNTEQRGLLALAARVAIIALAGAMALRQMGLANEIITLAFGLTLGAVAVAFALAFGLGGREAAGREVERLFESIRSRRANERALGAEQRLQQRQPGAGGLRNPAAGD